MEDILISSGIGIIGDIHKILKLRGIKGKYALLTLSDGTVCCGLVLNPTALGARVCTLKDVMTGIEKNVFWNHCTSIRLFDDEKSARKALDEYERLKGFEREVVVALTSSRDFYESCEEIHRKYSRVSVLSKSPGLLLPTEKFNRFSSEILQNYLQKTRGGYRKLSSKLSF